MRHRQLERMSSNPSEKNFDQCDREQRVKTAVKRLRDDRLANATDYTHSVVFFVFAATETPARKP